MEKHYLIGEFSEISGISKRMLRHYDKLDLFGPVALNEENGYRYYSENQMVELRKIQFLKDLGFTLTAIKDLMNKPLDIDSFKELLKDKEVEFTRVSDEVKSNLLLVKRSILYLENLSPRSIPTIDQLMDLKGRMMMEKVDLKKLMNRDAFMEKVDESLQKDQNDEYHFITSDIDNFMHVNDFYGFEVGDAVIQNIFSIIIHEMKTVVSEISEDMFIARLGGDECSIFLKNADHEKVIESINKILQNVRDFDFKSIRCGQDVTVSFGIYYGKKPNHVAQMNDQSHRALLEAKRNGRDRHVIF